MRRLRPDLAWREGGAGVRVLCDPITGREFDLSPLQVELLGGDEGHAPSPDPELTDALLDALAELGLVEPPHLGADALRELQREARRAFFADERLDKLRAALAAMRALPYYARVLADLPEVDSLASLAALPRLRKADVREHLVDLLPPGHDRGDLRWLSTSGTTDERVQVVRSQADRAAAQPWTWSLNRLVRDAVGERLCQLTTPRCDATACHFERTPRAARLDGPRLALETSAAIASLPDARIEEMIAELHAHAPTYLLVDPAYLAILCAHAERLRLALPRVRFVLTSYELCSDLHRRRIEDRLECPVFDVYGATEHGALALQCERGLYHVNPSAFIVEVDAPPGEPGQLLVTSLDKKVLPLLRYESGDLARAALAPCTCPWGETDVLLSLEGRLADCVTSTSGARLTPRAVDRALAPAAAGVVTYALVQRPEGVYQLDLLPAPDFRRDALGALHDALVGLLGPDARVRVTPRRELLPSPSGKFRLTRAER